MITPCVKKCKIDYNRICIGCQRTIEEISMWTKMTEEEKGKVLWRLKNLKSL